MPCKQASYDSTCLRLHLLDRLFWNFHRVQLAITALVWLVEIPRAGSGQTISPFVTLHFGVSWNPHESPLNQNGKVTLTLRLQDQVRRNKRSNQGSKTVGVYTNVFIQVSSTKVFVCLSLQRDRLWQDLLLKLRNQQFLYFTKQYYYGEFYPAKLMSFYTTTANITGPVEWSKYLWKKKCCGWPVVITPWWMYQRQQLSKNLYVLPGQRDMKTFSQRHLEEPITRIIKSQLRYIFLGGGI